MVEPEKPAQRCSRCQTELPSSLLSCPLCGRLVYADRLKELARNAELASAAGDGAEALRLWHEALSLLPVSAEQYKIIQDKISGLAGSVNPGVNSVSVPRSLITMEKAQTETKKNAAGLGAIGLLLWKFKLLILSVLAKGKLLLLGFTKLSTLFSMLLSLGVYWTAYGWRFAAGLVISIYIHEMGHVAWLRRYGLKAEAPLFIPGFGAFVKIKQSFDNPHQDARVGLAGPVSGLVTALLAYGISIGMHWPSWAAIAKVGAWINLFNLIPVWQLDGNRGFNALTRSERLAVLVVTASLWFVAREGMLLLILLLGASRTFREKGATEDDPIAFSQYVILLVSLTGLTKLIH